MFKTSVARWSVLNFPLEASKITLSQRKFPTPKFSSSTTTTIVSKASSNNISLTLLQKNIVDVMNKNIAYEENR